MHTRTRTHWLAAVVIATAGACTSAGTGPEPGTDPDSITEPTDSSTAAGSTSSTSPPVASPPGIPELAGLGGTLLVLDASGTLTVVRPDGTGAIELTSDPAVTATLTHARLDHDAFQVTQPTWSPGGESIAWTEERPGDGVYLVTASPNGADRTELRVPFPAVYLAWSPDAKHIAFFGNDPTDGSLQLATAALVSQEVSVVASGAPIYADWSPGSDELAVHADGELTIREPMGRLRQQIESSESFRVPMFVAESLLYAIDTEQGPVLVARDAAGAERELARFGGSLAVVAAPGGDRVAVLATGPPGFDIVTPRPGVTDLEGNELTIIDLVGGDQTLVSDQRAVVWDWAPHGTMLLFGTFEQEGLSRLFVRWQLWDGNDVTALGRVLPSSLVASGYYPFFDQFTRSITQWEPSAQAFVYAGASDAGRNGIWVQRVEDGADPVFLMAGVFAAWSPTP